MERRVAATIFQGGKPSCAKLGLGLSKTWCMNFKRSEEHTSELQSRLHLVCRLLLEKKKKKKKKNQLKPKKKKPQPPTNTPHDDTPTASTPQQHQQRARPPTYHTTRIQVVGHTHRRN